ncbi:MAG: TrkA C-terminal domain-containing protein [Nitriliruptorales bacterium]|nr:TrkA C-terminal domain-containing protein [Nitriliruptorales bacterium]
MAAIVTILVVVLASLIVTRIATTALTLTGMSQQAARFQARSALTGTGFTTSEAEAIVTHPVRRRIVMLLMLIGSAGVITVIGGFVIGFVGSSEADLPDWAKFLTLIGGLAVILGLFRIPTVDRGLQRVIRRLLRRYTDLEVRDYASLLHIHGDYSVSELRVEEHHWMNNQTLADLRLNDEGVLVLGIQRGDEEYVGAPKGHHELRTGDVLVIYGPGNRLEDLDRRPAGIAGHQAHEVATAEQQVVEDQERYVDDEGTSSPDPQPVDQ